MKRLPVHFAALVLLVATAARADLVHGSAPAAARTAVHAAAAAGDDQPVVPAIVLDGWHAHGCDLGLCPWDSGTSSAAFAARSSLGLGRSSPCGPPALACHPPEQSGAATQPIRPIGPDIRRLPPGGDTDALCLSGLLSLGAFQLARRARHVQFGVPEWYHAETRSPVGHAVAFDLMADCTLLAACPFDLPSDLDRPAPTCRQRFLVEPLRCESQSILLTEAPRGPPLLSL